MNPISTMLDYNAWVFVQMYYLPYFIIGKGDEISRFTRQFNPLNVKLYNICNPK